MSSIAWFLAGLLAGAAALLGGPAVRRSLRPAGPGRKALLAGGLVVAAAVAVAGGVYLTINFRQARASDAEASTMSAASDSATVMLPSSSPMPSRTRSRPRAPT